MTQLKPLNPSNINFLSSPSEAQKTALKRGAGGVIIIVNKFEKTF